MSTVWEWFISLWLHEQNLHSGSFSCRWCVSPSLLQTPFRSIIITCAVALQLPSGVHFKLGAVPSQGCGLGRQTIILLAQDERCEWNAPAQKYSWYSEGMLAAILNSSTELFQRGLNKYLREEIQKLVKIWFKNLFTFISKWLNILSKVFHRFAQ